MCNLDGRSPSYHLSSYIEPVWIGVFLEKNAQFDTKRNIHNRLEKLFQLNHVYKSHKSAVSKKQYLISFSISSTLNVFAPLFFSFKKPKIPPNSWLYYPFFFSLSIVTLHQFPSITSTSLNFDRYINSGRY